MHASREDLQRAARGLYEWGTGGEEPKNLGTEIDAAIQIALRAIIEKESELGNKIPTKLRTDFARVLISGVEKEQAVIFPQDALATRHLLNLMENASPLARKFPRSYLEEGST